MLHFASDFLAQQLVCCVHVFWVDRIKLHDGIKRRQKV